jgi:protein TonB
VNLRALSPLQLALGVSVAVHAVLLTVRIVDPAAFNRVFEDTPLEVILVNARTQEKPDKARAIAQATLAGGGEAERGRATSPLPSALLSDSGDALEDTTQRRLQAMQQQQSLLLAQIRQQIAALPQVDPRQPSEAPQQVARDEKRRQLIKLLAEIERRIEAENARPRKRYISPATREEVYALYYDRLRRAIEDRGTEHFPEAGGRKLYGELTMIVTVNHNGQVLATEVAESSGNRTLDRRAQAIARSAGPFGAFSPAMRRQAEQIVVVSRFRFTREQTLETRISAPLR